MLSPKQERFCTEFIKLGNATAAYKAAYSVTNTGTAKANASKLLKNPAIQARLAELQAEVTDSEICSAREIQTRLSAIARREVYETVTLPNGQQVQKPTSIRDSVRALELLAKVSGLFITKQEIDLNGTLPVVILDDI